MDKKIIEWQVLGYDKDNDVYDELKVGLKTKGEALKYAQEFERQMKDDSLKSSAGDPYDWIVIDKYEDGDFIGDYTYYGGEIMDAYFINESFNSQELSEFMRLSAKLGLKTMGDVDKFSKEHNNVKDQALLQAMRDAVAKKDECKESVEESESFNANKWMLEKIEKANAPLMTVETYFDSSSWEDDYETRCAKDKELILGKWDESITKINIIKRWILPKSVNEMELGELKDFLSKQDESLKESVKESKAQFTTIENAFKDVSGVQKVFDKDGHFAIDYEKYAQKVADKYFDGNIDKVDAMCSEEGCFKESVKEDFNNQALADLYNDSNVDFQIATYNGEDFMIVGGWDDVREIQKALDPSFEPKDKYDSSVLDEYINWGFYDSYTICDNCGEVICTEPDSYSWVPDYYVGENGIICGDCVRADRDISIEYLQDLINNPKKANTILTENDLESLGFVRMDGDYQNGWYDRSDSPEEILDNLLEQYPDGAFIFSITGQGQFHTNFEVWGEEDTMQSYEED